MGRLRNVLRAGKIARLYAGEVNASSMGLKDTADRLSILRKTLARQKDHSESARTDMNLWAFRKLRDIKATLKEENREMGKKPAPYPEEQSSENWNSLMKIIGAGIALTVIGDAFYKVQNAIYTQSKALMVAGIAVAGMLGVFHIANKFFSRTLDESYHRLKDMIESISASFSRKLPEPQKAPVHNDEHVK